MKYKVLILLSSFSCPALCLDFTPDGSRIVSDPSYLPLQNQIFGSTEYGYSHEWGKESIDFVGLYRSNTFNNEMHLVRQYFSYGISDALSINMSEDYQFKSGNNSDFTNPNFATRWRVFDQLDNKLLNWDLAVNYSPNVRSGTQGASISGGDSGGISTALSYKTKDLTLYGSATIDFLDGTKTQHPYGFYVSNNASNNYILALNTQTRIDDRWSVNAGITEVVRSNQNFTQGVNFSNFNFTYINKLYDTTTLNTAINYHVVPNRLVTSIKYSHEFFGGYSLGGFNSNGPFLTLNTEGPHYQTSTDNYYFNVSYVFN